MKNLLEFESFKQLQEQTLLLGSAANATRFNLSKGSQLSQTGNRKGVPEVNGLDDTSSIPRRTTFEEKLKETFKKARLLKKPSTPTTKEVAKKLNSLMKGWGGNSKVIEILRKVKTLDELSSIILAYKEIYKSGLYRDISNEWNLSWDNLWNSVSRLNPSVSQYVSGTVFA